MFSKAIRMMAMCVAWGVGIQSAHSALIDISGGTTTLNQVIGNSFIVGDKQFDINAFSASGFDPAALVIQSVNNGLAGIGFDLVGPFLVVGSENDLLNLSSDGNGGSKGFTLNFTVTLLDPNFLINDMHLELDGFRADNDKDFSPGDDESHIDVVETISGAGITPPIVLTAGVSESMTTPTDWQLLDIPVSSVTVEKVVDLFANEDLDLSSTVGDGDVEVSFVRQTFSQIPEPSTVGMIGIGVWFMIRRLPRRLRNNN